jgi:ATP-dependent DNA helicase DinG
MNMFPGIIIAAVQAGPSIDDASGPISVVCVDAGTGDIRWEGMLPDNVFLLYGLLAETEPSLVVAENEEAAASFHMVLQEHGYAVPRHRIINIKWLQYVLYPRRNRDSAQEAAGTPERKDSWHRGQPTSPALRLILTVSRLWQKAVGLPLLVLQQLSALSRSDPRFGNFFDLVLETVPLRYETLVPPGCATIHSLMHRVVAIPENREEERPAYNPDGDEVAAVLGESGPLSAALEGFEPRPGQLRMAASVYEALTDGHHLMIEAGTGTGKSLGYLVPALVYARSTGDRVVVATHTIHLQEQLRTRDIPLLQRILPFPFHATVLKGRSNYLCMRKLAHRVSQTGWVPEGEGLYTAYWMKLLVWLLETESGDREEIASLRDRDQEPFSVVASETETCISKSCPWFRHCYYHRAKAAAQASDIIITNHSLVFTDMKTGHYVLPPYNRLILDEGHHLEEEVVYSIPAARVYGPVRNG